MISPIKVPDKRKCVPNNCFGGPWGPYEWRESIKKSFFELLEQEKPRYRY